MLEKTSNASGCGGAAFRYEGSPLAMARVSDVNVRVDNARQYCHAFAVYAFKNVGGGQEIFFADCGDFTASDDNAAWNQVSLSVDPRIFYDDIGFHFTFLQIIVLSVEYRSILPRPAAKCLNGYARCSLRLWRRCRRK